MSSLPRLFYSYKCLERTYLVFSRDADSSVFGPEGNHGAAKDKRLLNSAPGPAGIAFNLNYQAFDEDLLNQGRGGEGICPARSAARPGAPPGSFQHLPAVRGTLPAVRGAPRCAPSPLPPPYSRRAAVAELVGHRLDAAGPRHGDVAALEAQVEAHHGHGRAAVPALRGRGGRGAGGWRRRFKYDNGAKFPEAAAAARRLHVRLPLPPSAAFSNDARQSAPPGKP